MSIKSYITGFILSLLLVLAAYFVVTNSGGQQEAALSQGVIIGIIFALAIIQVFVQLKCFLHIGFDLKSRIQTSVLVFTVIGMGILVSGSLWIMYHLNYNMTPSDQTQIILQEEGIQM